MEDNKVSHRAIAGFYNNEYYRDAGLHPAAQYKYRDLLERLHLQADDRILDIACGTGNWLAVASQHSKHIFGLDISETALGVCRIRLPDSGICAGLGENLPFADANFDVITCLGSLEHFLDQGQALREICRVAKDGARILILVPNAGFLTYRLGLYRGTNQSRVRETIRSLKDWQDLFDQSGLVVTERWADLHVLDRHWIMRGAWYQIPLRALQAIMLLIWPLQWQYQVNFLCRSKR